jgi:hypothetical protein
MRPRQGPPHLIGLHGGPLRRGAITWFTVDGLKGEYRADAFMLETFPRVPWTRSQTPLLIEVDGVAIPFPWFPFVARKSIRVCVEWEGDGVGAVAGLRGEWKGGRA